MCMWCIKYLKFVTKFNSATIKSCLSSQNSVGKDAGSKSNSSSSSNSKCSVDKVASSSSSSKVTVAMVGWTMVGWRTVTMRSAVMSKRTSLHSVHSCVRRSKRRWKGQILCRPKSFADFFTQGWWGSRDCKREQENLRGKRELPFDVYIHSSLMLAEKAIMAYPDYFKMFELIPYKWQAKSHGPHFYWRLYFAIPRLTKLN